MAVIRSALVGLMCVAVQAQKASITAKPVATDPTSIEVLISGCGTVPFDSASLTITNGVVTNANSCQFGVKCTIGVTLFNSPTLPTTVSLVYGTSEPVPVEILGTSIEADLTSPMMTKFNRVEFTYTANQEISYRESPFSVDSTVPAVLEKIITSTPRQITAVYLASITATDGEGEITVKVDGGKIMNKAGVFIGSSASKTSITTITQITTCQYSPYVASSLCSATCKDEGYYGSDGAGLPTQNFARMLTEGDSDCDEALTKTDVCDSLPFCSGSVGFPGSGEYKGQCGSKVVGLATSFCEATTPRAAGGDKFEENSGCRCDFACEAAGNCCQSYYYNDCCAAGENCESADNKKMPVEVFDTLPICSAQDLCDGTMLTGVGTYKCSCGAGCAGTQASDFNSCCGGKAGYETNFDAASALCGQ